MSLQDLIYSIEELLDKYELREISRTVFIIEIISLIKKYLTGKSS